MKIYEKIKFFSKIFIKFQALKWRKKTTKKTAI
jgi:hypothetical protein